MFVRVCVGGERNGTACAEPVETSPMFSAAKNARLQSSVCARARGTMEKRQFPYSAVAICTQEKKPT